MTPADRILRALTWAALALNVHWWLTARWAANIDDEYRTLCAGSET